LDPNDLIGCSFLKDQENGERHRVQIVQLMDDHLDQIEQHPDRIKFLCKVNEDKHEELIAYNEILIYLDDNENTMTTPPEVWWSRCNFVHVSNNRKQCNVMRFRPHETKTLSLNNQQLSNILVDPGLLVLHAQWINSTVPRQSNLMVNQKRI
jgi:hypothetical protein